MFNRTIQSIYRFLTLSFILVIGLVLLSHSGHTAEPEVWFSFKGEDANVAEDASGNGNDGVIIGGAQRVPSKEGVFGMGMEFGDNKEDFIEFDYLMPTPARLDSGLSHIGTVRVTEPIGYSMQARLRSPSPLEKAP